MTRRLQEIRELQKLGFTEQAAATLLFIAERFGGQEYENPKNYQGYRTTFLNGKMPLNERTLLEHIGLSTLNPVSLRELLDLCPTFAREFKPSQDRLQLPEKEYLYILATCYNTWVCKSRGAMVFCSCDCKDYTGNDGWQFFGTRGVMFIFREPYYGLGPKDDTDRQGVLFQCSYDAAREVHSYAGVSYRFPPGTNLGEFANTLLTDISFHNLQRTKNGNPYFLENGRTLYGIRQRI